MTCEEFQRIRLEEAKSLVVLVSGDIYCPVS